MYTIRVEASLHLLRVELSGRVTTEEALRAINQSAMLAEAGGLGMVLCDMRETRRGPGDLAVVAASLALRAPEGMRIALACEPAQVAIGKRLVRFSGLRRSLQVFDSVATAEAWLGALDRAARPRIAGTERRHAESVLTPAGASAREAKATAIGSRRAG
ncbi:MAG: STAS/SEC14 domain-containing protein [Chloroflexi bacterium]|nr:STAS/SEC14 domain-containing protein [Chloroflexota bacterium]